MRQFYLMFGKSQTVSGQLSWSHYVELLKLKSKQEIKYYINISIVQNLSVRELRERIKSKEYERIGYKDELEKPKINTLIKNPIIIKNDKDTKDVNEYVLHQLILENMDSFLKELGIGFCLYW